MMKCSDEGSLKQLRESGGMHGVDGPRTAGERRRRGECVEARIFVGMVVVRGCGSQEHEEEYEGCETSFESLAPEGPVERYWWSAVVMTSAIAGGWAAERGRSR